jgi:hypothetical protein
MAVKREQRFPSARALAEALAPFAQSASAFDATLLAEPSLARPVGQSIAPPVHVKTSDGITMGRSAPDATPQPNTPSSSRTKGVIAAVVIAVAAIAAFLAIGREHGGQTPAASTFASASSTAGATATATATTSTLATTTTTAPPPSASASAVASVRLPAAASSPRAKPSGNTRVDQKGLAGDNPF